MRSARHPWQMGAIALVLVGSTGCIRGFVRGQSGAAFNTADRHGQSGPMTGVDTAITLKKFPIINNEKPVPIAIHVSGEAILAPDRKNLSWGTGLIYTTPPRPISPYLIFGTTGHGDYINGRYSFGNVSPYAELGLMTPLFRPNANDDEDGLVLTYGLGTYSFINFLAGSTVDAFVSMRFGLAWEKN